MATYGKKKRSILPSFSVLRDSNATSKSKKDAIRKRGSTVCSVPVFCGSESKTTLPSRHDDSIDEMASMLLEDSEVGQFKFNMSKVSSQDATSKVLRRISQGGSPDDKALPRLPQLLFNGDDAWAMKATPVVTSAGRTNEMQFFGQLEDPDSYTPQIFSHAIKDLAPTIPRRSSKRKSAGPKDATSSGIPEASDQAGAAKSNKTPQGNLTPPKPLHIQEPKESKSHAVDLNNKIEAMMAATRTLKPTADGALQQGPFVPAKTRRFKDSKVILKMKTAINDRLSARSGKRRHDPARDDHLLDSSLNEVNESDEELSTSVSALTALEIRMNEGDNFKNPKIFSLTGHGNVRRKPIADDGRSLRSRKSISDDPFSEAPQLSGMIRTPTNFEHRLKEDMSSDHQTDTIPDLPSRPLTFKDGLSQAKNLKSSLLVYEADFDALFSSSPVAQSTPRIRLEPNFEEDGTKTLKQVPAGSRSLFDREKPSIDPYSDTEVDLLLVKMEPDQRFVDHVKRKNCQVREVGLGVRCNSKRMKKHPSPSKAELEGLERAMRQNAPFGTSESSIPSEPFMLQDEISADVVSLFPVPTALGPKDANKKLQEPLNQHEKGKGVGMFLKADFNRAASSMPNLSRRPKAQKSMIPKPAEAAKSKPRQVARDNRFYSVGNDIIDASAMDIDELQWDQTAYHIGMKRG